MDALRASRDRKKIYQENIIATKRWLNHVEKKLKSNAGKEVEEDHSFLEKIKREKQQWKKKIEDFQHIILELEKTEKVNDLYKTFIATLSEILKML